MVQQKPSVIGVMVIVFLLALGSSKVASQTYTDLHDFNCTVEGCSPQFSSFLAQGRDGNLYGTTFDGGTYKYGTVFKATPSGTVTTLYNFDGTTGAYPQAGLTLASDGNFYGTTQKGGAYNYGTIFGITPSGTLTVLHTFNGTDGGGSLSPPVQASNGSLYGLTQISFTAYKVTLAGKFTLLSTPMANGTFAPLIQAWDGYLYGTNPGGGLGPCAPYGCVFRMSLAGAFKTIYKFDNTHGAEPYSPVTQANDKNLYGTTPGGGKDDSGVAFKLTTKGAIKLLHEFTGSYDGGSPDAGLVASDGYLYGAATGGGTGPYGTLFDLTRTGAFSVLYDFDYTHGGNPYASSMQHTNGTIYGLAAYGGAYGGGVLYSLNAGLRPFVALMGILGKPGQIARILGQGFTTATSVTFGTGSAIFAVGSDTFMIAVIPAEGTSGYVRVITGSGTLTSNKQFRVVPIIISFKPPSGPVGTQVTIMGGGFHGATKVTFGGVGAIFTVDSGSQITATVPTGAVTGPITVTTPGGTATSGKNFIVT
jgi:uncharacterized repeat protein (TIGR03803 family)